MSATESSAAETLGHLFRDAGPAVVLSTAALSARVRNWLGAASELAAVPWLETDVPVTKEG